MHKSHFRDSQSYFCDFVAISHLIKYLISITFNPHTYLVNSMLFSRDLFLKEHLWLL